MFQSTQRAVENDSRCIHLHSLDYLRVGLNDTGVEGTRSDDPRKTSETGLLAVSEAVSSKVTKLIPRMSAMMDVFNNTHCPSGTKVQNSSTFPLSELDIIKYLRLELSFILDQCLRWGGRRNPSLNCRHLEMLIFLRRLSRNQVD